MEQLLCHVVGDYVLQSDWMAMNKNKRTIPCLVHILIYTSVFLFLTTSWKALLVIGGVHFILDRFPIIIKRLIWMKNHVNPSICYPCYDFCDTTGYYDDSQFNTGKYVNEGQKNYVEDPERWGKPRLFFITAWLYIITDNFLHLLTNYLAIKYLT